jgi:hypothetical protein
MDSFAADIYSRAVADALAARVPELLEPRGDGEL